MAARDLCVAATEGTRERDRRRGQKEAQTRAEGEWQRPVESVEKSRSNSWNSWGLTKDSLASCRTDTYTGNVPHAACPIHVAPVVAGMFFGKARRACHRLWHSHSPCPCPRPCRPLLATGCMPHTHTHSQWQGQCHPSCNLLPTPSCNLHLHVACGMVKAPQ